MAGRRVVVEFLGKDTSLSKTSADVESKTSKLGRRMAKVGKVAAIGLGVGAVVAAKGLFEMGKAAAEDEVSAKLLEGQLKRSANATDAQVAATEDWITAQGKALGVADDELRPALANLARATGDVGEAQKLASLAMDASAGTGKDLSTVSEALRKGAQGQTGALGRLGVATKDASGKALTFDEITANMAKTFGGAASEKANTLQGRIDRLRLMFDETKEAIGARLLPVAERLVGWFVNDGLPAIKNFSDFLQTRVGPVIENVRAVISRVFSGSSGDVSGAMTNIREVITSALSIIQSLWGRFGGSILAFTRGAFVAVRTVVSGALQVIAGIIRTVAAVLRGDWAGAWSGIKSIVSGAWTVIRGVVRLGWEAIKGVFRTGGAAIRGIFSGAWSAIKALARTSGAAVVAAVRGIPGKLRALSGVFGAAGRALIQAFVNGMKNAAGIVSGIAGKVWTSVKRLLNGAINRINSALEFRIKIPGAPDVSINPPNIPHLAKGGVVRATGGGVVARLAEAGHNEMVTPLSGPHMPAWLKRLRDGAGDDGRPILVQLVLDGKVIHQSLLKRKRETGGSLGLA
ncbi:hypothetical protein GCM10008944_01660 [Cytobacillus oceanisediminis]